MLQWLLLVVAVYEQMSGGGWLLKWLLLAVVVYEQMNERWLVVAWVVVGCCSVLADEWEVAGCCSGCCQLLQCMSR